MIEKILKSHGIKVKVENNQIFALEELYNTNTKIWVETWIDVTNWTKQKTLEFLGY